VVFKCQIACGSLLIFSCHCPPLAQSDFAQSR
jgi:hypothetical protein